MGRPGADATDLRRALAALDAAVARLPSKSFVVGAALAVAASIGTLVLLVDV